jgi:cell division protein FtsB
MTTDEETLYEEPIEGRNRRNGRNNVLLILLTLLLLASIGFNIYQHFDQQQKDKTSNEAILSSKDLQTQLTSQKETALAQLEEYKGRNAKLDAEIEKDQKDIVARAEQISKLLKSNKLNFNKYLEVKDKLESMTYLKDKYMKQVAELSEQNKELNSQNQNLKKEVTAGKQTIDKLVDKTTSMKNKVDLASRLTANNISVTGVYFKKNNKEVESSKSKHITKLKFCYTLAENKIADPGKRDVFVQVIDPHGQTVAIQSLGSGTTTVDAVESQYTTKDEV